MGQASPWSEFSRLLIDADLVISTTSATEPILSLPEYKKLEAARFQRTLVVLDLAVPRDFDPAIDECLGVYLYSIDDLQKVCERNKRKRQKEWPKAQKIVDQETARFDSDLKHRITGPAIRELRSNVDELKAAELARLFNKLNGLDEDSKKEIERSVERLINKVLHPPLESLRVDAGKDESHGLLIALKKLFQLSD